MSTSQLNLYIALAEPLQGGKLFPHRSTPYLPNTTSLMRNHAVLNINPRLNPGTPSRARITGTSRPMARDPGVE
jgi:hypothetical protein